MVHAENERKDAIAAKKWKAERLEENRQQLIDNLTSAAIFGYLLRFVVVTTNVKSTLENMMHATPMFILIPLTHLLCVYMLALRALWSTIH